jgi:protein-S-isoprenylcysteine O-methyltransferase Ste14
MPPWLPLPALLLFLWIKVHRLWANSLGPLRERPQGERRWTTALLIAQNIALMAICFSNCWARWHAPTLPALLGGNLLAAAGCVLIRRGRLELAESYSIHLGTRPGHRLVTSGPYARLRHPMYAGSLVFQAGAVLLTSAWEAALLLPPYAALLLMRACTEETALLARFPEYGHYSASTPRVFPGLFGR